MKIKRKVLRQLSARLRELNEQVSKLYQIAEELHGEIEELAVEIDVEAGTISSPEDTEEVKKSGWFDKWDKSGSWEVPKPEDDNGVLAAPHGDVKSYYIATKKKYNKDKADYDWDLHIGPTLLSELKEEATGSEGTYIVVSCDNGHYKPVAIWAEHTNSWSDVKYSKAGSQQ